MKRRAEDDQSAPRFKRGYIFTSNVSSESQAPPSISSTYSAPPLPRPPQHILDDPQIQASLAAVADYIHVDTPFNVDRIESLLTKHPNRPFVDSVLCSLREGFWPFHDGEWESHLKERYDNYATEAQDLAELRVYRDQEIAAGRWSPALPEDFVLLPGMRISPMFVVWQKGKPRIVMDHTGNGLNDGISREDAKVRYDDMHSFGQLLNDVLKAHPHEELLLFKSDVSKAFLNLPAHPIWQLHQVVTVDGRYHIVRRLILGTRASPRCWCSFSGLLNWIAWELGVIGLHDYMDDFFGWDFKRNLVMFHGKLRPRRQVQLLVFWDLINCPYEDKKQEHGVTLKIIGFWVDICSGSISLSPDSLDSMVNSINEFLAQPKPPLQNWQQLAGYLNWVLNVLPWARPALTELYRKMSGKTVRFKGIPLNAEVKQDLSWFVRVAKDCIGIRFVDAQSWSDSEADFVGWTDASNSGLAFVYAGNGYAYQLKTITGVDTFFRELLAILCLIHHVASFPTPPRRILVHSDSMDSVAVFNSLSASQSSHNAILLAIADIVLRTGIDVRVRHIPGVDNIKADLLSRLLFVDFSKQFPSYRVRTFQPPRELVPARWRECF